MGAGRVFPVLLSAVVQGCNAPAPPMAPAPTRGGSAHESPNPTPAPSASPEVRSGARQEKKSVFVPIASIDVKRVPLQCANDVRLGRAFGPMGTQTARAVSDSTFVAVVDRDTVMTSFDAGKNWVRTLDAGPREDGPEWLEVDGMHRVWGVSRWNVWESNDARTWTKLAEPDAGPGHYRQLEPLLQSGRVWLTPPDDGPRDLIGPSATDPYADWARVPIPGNQEVHGVAPLGNRFVSVVQDGSGRLLVAFDEHSSQAWQAPAGGSLLTCGFKGCAVGGEDGIGVFGAPGEPWSFHDGVFELMTWYVEHCSTKDLGRVATIIRKVANQDPKWFKWYSPTAYATDGDSVAIAVSISDDNDAFYPASLVVSPRGVDVVPAGFNGVSVVAEGRYWFTGPQIHPVFVGPSRP